MIIIDRFEDGDAILETETGMQTVKRAVMPPEAAEGDVLSYENGVYRVDAQATEARRQAIKRKLKMLLGG